MTLDERTSQEAPAAIITRPLNSGIHVLLALLSLMVTQLTSASEVPVKGKMAVSAKDAVPAWPQPILAPDGAPNIVIILLDDIGFADAGTFGGLAQTPVLDRLAAQGLRYINFHTTGMCSPTRAALLAGRNHHRVGFGVAEIAGPFPGYNSVWKTSTVSVAEVLRRHGYSTAVIGKWHNTPHWEISPIGPFDRWPTNLGFDYFYGFMAGMENHWEPSRLYRNTTAIEASATPREGYHLTTDITDEAIRWLRTQASLAPEKPYLLYFATGAPHAPHHAPQKWIDPYRGRFDLGWDQLREDIFARQKRLGVVPSYAELTPRPEQVPAWDSLSADQKRLYARQMEVYAGFVAHADHEIGRLLQAVEQGPNPDNTLILYIVGDNGPAATELEGRTDGMTAVADQLERIDDLGSPRAPLNSYSSGWAWLGSTPFQYWKGIASHLGATRTPLIVSWPARIKDRGGVRLQFTHVNDVAATLYEATGVRFPAVVDGVKQQPLDGVTFAQTFQRTDARSSHRTQYFEMSGSRALYRDGWVAAARYPGARGDQRGHDFAHDHWELYHLDEDFSQARDLAAQYPGKLKELQRLFDREARKNDVYPLGGAFIGRTPALSDNRSDFVYFSGTPRIPETAMPPLAGKSYRLVADVVIPESGAEGVILSYGGRESGFAFYLKEGRLYYENNPLNGTRERIRSNTRLPGGTLELTYEFIKGSGVAKNVYGEISSGTGRLLINGQTVGEAPISGAFQIARQGPGSLGIGQAFGSPVSDAFVPPFKFTGLLKKVTVELK